MISKEEVLRITALARLELTGQEVEKMQKDLSQILDYFAILQKAPKVSKLPARAQEQGNAVRDDEVLPSASLPGDLMNAAPATKDGYIKVQAVL